MVGDSVTTDHISPAGSIKETSPAGRFLQQHGVKPDDFNSYGSRRGNDRVMTRGTFANIRLRNQLAPGTEGGVTKYLPTGEVISIYDASLKYKQSNTPLIVLAGKEYGTGSSRDWAAKGTYLLGIKAVIAESFERIHRSNLVGMGVLPLQFRETENREALGLDGTETFEITLDDTLKPQAGRRSHRHEAGRHCDPLHDRLPHRYAGRGEVLPQRRHPAHGAPRLGEGVTMKGIQFLVDENGKKTAVLIDLKRNRELWEDFFDKTLAEQRKSEPRLSLAEVQKRVNRSGKLKGDG